MPDGSQTALLTVAQTREPSLASALDALLACAEQGLHPDAVLGDVRTLLSGRGLLLHGGSAEQAAEPRTREARRSGDPAPPPCGCASAS